MQCRVNNAVQDQKKTVQNQEQKVKGQDKIVHDQRRKVQERKSTIQDQELHTAVQVADSVEPEQCMTRIRHIQCGTGNKQGRTRSRHQTVKDQKQPLDGAVPEAESAGLEAGTKYCSTRSRQCRTRTRH
jgi:hypothetical protein